MSALLQEKLAEVKRAFDIAPVLALAPDENYTRDYYRVNKILYSLAHSYADFIYMGISRDGVFKRDDLREIARMLAQFISTYKSKDILELATGRGANATYLAKRFPEARTTGIDISDAQLSLAHKKARRVKNYVPQKGDYHDLSRFESASFDLVYVVEALCYSTRKEVILAEVYRVLRPGGLFIVFDGYQKKREAELTEDEKVAGMLVEKGMALPDFEEYASFRAKAAGRFIIMHEEDLSPFIVPTMRRLERRSRMLFTHPRLAHGVSAILPPILLNNAVSMHLMPAAMEDGLYCYMLTVLKK